jgi:hypothetical protein
MGKSALMQLDVTDLLGMERDDVLSVALDVDPTKPEHQDEHPAWRTWLRGALRDLAASVPDAQRKGAEARAEEVLGFLERERPQGRGLAIFAGTDLWRVLVLPVPLRNHAAYGRPEVLPVLWAMDEYEPYAILAVSRERARLLVAYLGGTAVAASDVLELDMTEWRFKSGRPPTFRKATGTGASRGAQRDTHEARVADHRRRFWAGAADAAGRYLEDTAIERLVICGPQEAAHAVRDLLAPAARDAVVAVVPVPDDADPTEIHRRTLPVALAEERRRDRELVDHLTHTPPSPDVVVGVREVLGAAAREQLLTIAVDRDVDVTVGRCRQCGTIQADPAPPCAVCGGLVAPVPLAQVTPLLARRTGARLELVAGEDAERLRRCGGIGGILRYRVG